MLDLLLVLVFAAHLLAVNVASGGPLVAIWLLWRQRSGDQTAGRLGLRLARGSTVALVLAVALGSVAAALLWRLYPHTISRAVSQIPERRYWFAVVELGFSFACLAGCLALWPPVRTSGAGRPAATWGSIHGSRDAGRDELPHAEREGYSASDELPHAEREGYSGRAGGYGFCAAAALLLLAGSNLLYHFPPLFAVIGMLSTRPSAWGTGTKFTSLMLDPEVLARALHFALSSFAVTGLAVSALGLRQSESDRAHGDRAVAWGGRIALAPTLLQLLVGICLLATLAEPSRQWLLGADVLATGLFMAGLLASLALVHCLVNLSWPGAAGRDISRCAVVMVVVVVLMVAARHRARQAVFSEERPPGPAMVDGGIACRQLLILR